MGGWGVPVETEKWPGGRVRLAPGLVKSRILENINEYSAPF
ncbi:hypothetical protein [Maribellus maritimus]|nr:hypothetical protein [Maribellus maritimus]